MFLIGAFWLINESFYGSITMMMINMMKFYLLPCNFLSVNASVVKKIGMDILYIGQFPAHRRN